MGDEREEYIHEGGVGLQLDSGGWGLKNNPLESADQESGQ